MENIDVGKSQTDGQHTGKEYTPTAGLGIALAEGSFEILDILDKGQV